MAKHPKRKWPRRVGITVAVLVILYTVLGFWGVPLASRYIVLPMLNDSVPGRGEVEAFYFNPYTYQAKIEGFTGYTPDGGEAITFRELRVDFDFWSLFEEDLRFEELYLGDPSMTLIINEDGSANIEGGLTTIHDEVEAHLRAQAAGEAPIEIPIVEIGRLVVENASFSAQINNLKDPFERHIENLSFTMQDIRTSPDKRNDYHFSFNTKTGEIVKIDGAVKLDPLSSDGNITIDTVKLGDFNRFADGQLGFDLVKGELSFAAEYNFSPVKEPHALFVRNGKLLLEGLELRPRGEDEPFQTLERLAIEGFDVYMFRGTVGFDKIAITNGMLKVTRDKEGVLSLVRYLLPEARQEQIAQQVAKEQTADIQEAKASREFVFGLLSDQEDLGLAFTSAWQQLQEMLGVTWELKVGELNVVNQNLILVDEVPASPVSVTLGNINLTVSQMGNLSTEPFPFDLALTVNETGKVAANGTFTAVPAATDFKYDISGIDLATFSPYFEVATPATLNRAVLGNKGTLKASFPDDALPSVETRFTATVADFDATVGEPLYPSDKAVNIKTSRITKSGNIAATFPKEGLPDVKATVDVRLEGFSLAQGSVEQLVDWSKLDMTGIEATSIPIKVSADTLTIEQLIANVVRNADGSINLLALVSGSAEQAASATEPATDAPAGESKARAETSALDLSNFGLKQFVLKQGTVKVQDVSVTPNADFSLTEIEATVGPIKLTPETVTSLDSSMRVVAGGEGTIAIKGAASPLNPRAQTQATIIVEGVPMTGFSGYAAQAVGSPITSGTLNANLSYDVKTDSLKGDNKLAITKVRFGKRVPDSKAPNLPLEMGIAVLENRNGVIDLNVPISGNLSDPKFSLTGVLQGAFSNVLGKVVTSPFSLLGSAFGSDGVAPPTEVTFAPGSAEVRESSREPLALLAKAVYDRPSLELKLVPSIDPDKDVAFFREKLVQQAITKRMEAEDDDEGEAVEDLFDVAFPKGLPPKDDGTKVTLTTGLMRAKLVEVQVVPDAELATLAQERAAAISAAILAAQSLDTTRVTDSAPEGGFAKDGAKVSFQLGVAKAK